MARSVQRQQRSQQSPSSFNFPNIPPVPPIPAEALSMNPSSGSGSSSSTSPNAHSSGSSQRREDEPRQVQLPPRYSSSVSPISPTSQQQQRPPSSSPTSPTSPHLQTHISTSPSNDNSNNSNSPTGLARADSARAHTRTPSSDYPSWLPRRPLAPPPPASTTTTLAHRRTPLPFQDSDGDVGPYGDVTDAEMETGATRRPRDIQDGGGGDSDIEEVGRTNGESERELPSETESAFIRNLGGRKPTPRSVRIVSLPHSPVSPHPLSALQPSPVIPRLSSGGQGATTAGSNRLPFHKRVWSRATGVFSHRRHASRPGLPTEFAEKNAAPATPSRSRPASLPTSPNSQPKPRPAPPSISHKPTGLTPTFNHPALNLNLIARSRSLWYQVFYRLWPLWVLAHIPIQIWLDYTAVWVLISVARHPSPLSPNGLIPSTRGDSSRSWALATAAYLGCSVAWLFGVVVMYEVVYCFVRRWRIKRPLVLPIYLSAPAFNYAAMTSYEVFCFLLYMRWSVLSSSPSKSTATPTINPNTRAISTRRSRHPNDPSDPTTVVGQDKEKEAGDASLPIPTPNTNIQSTTPVINDPGVGGIGFEAGGGWKQWIAESCWFYSQNLVTVVFLVPRGGLVLALLFAFSGAQVFGNPGTTDNPATPRDPTYFRVQDGSLTNYARGVLIANAVWAAWRILLVLLSWFGLWILSGHLCGGICGPRYRWEEDEYGYGDEQAYPSEKRRYPYTIYAQNTSSLSPYGHMPRQSSALPYARRSYPMPQTPTLLQVPPTPGVSGPPSRLAGNQDPEKLEGLYVDEDGVVDWELKKREEKGPGLPWIWREMTKARVRQGWDGCFVMRVRNVDVAVEKDGVRLKERAPRIEVDSEIGGEGGGGFEGIERVLAAVGLPGSPAPARRGVLRDDLFSTPELANKGLPAASILEAEKTPHTPTKSTDSGDAGVGGSGSSSRRRREKAKGKKRELQVSPYPFAGKGAHVSSEDEPVPFPPSPGLYQPTTEEEEEEEEEHVVTSDEPTSASSSSRVLSTSSGAHTSSSGRRQTMSSERASGSMSSLGQPVNSRYPFQFRRPPPGHHAQHSHSESQSTGPSGNDRSGHSYMTASTGNRESTDSSSRPRYSLSDASAVSPSMSMSLGSPLGSPVGTGVPGRRNRQSLGAESAMSGSIPMPPRHPGPHRGRGRGRAGSVPSTIGGGGGQVLSYYSSGPGSPVSPDMENPPPSPTHSHPFPSDDDDELGDRARVVGSDPEKDVSDDEAEDGGEGARESEDVVGLLGQPSGGPSPKSSFTALRHRGSGTLSLTSPHRARRSGSRSATNSISEQSSSSRSRAGSSRSRAGSMISVHVRSRTQSLMQGIGAASHSSLELVQATFGGRSRANSSMARLSEDGGESDIQSSRPSMTRDRAWAERVRQDDTQTHSRSGSGNISDAVMSSISGSTGTSGSEFHTFGHPLRTQWHDGEGGSGSPSGHVPPSPIPESPRSASPVTHGGLEVPRRASHPSLSTASVGEGTISGLTPRQLSEEPESPQATMVTARSQPIQIPHGRRELLPPVLGGGSSVDMISTADQSFVTAPATVEGQTTDSGEARTLSSWGGGGDTAGLAPRRVDQPGAWGPA